MIKTLSHFLNRFIGLEKPLRQSLRNVLGFHPGRISIYKAALRHKSVAEEIQKGSFNSNERLEFLGDAILDAVIADYLFQRYPYKDEGFLTQLRSKVVNREQLNRLAGKLGLAEMISVSQGVNKANKTIHGNAMEAVIGAIYLDKGYRFVYRYIINQLLKIHINLEQLEEEEWNYKSRVIEWGQKEKREVEFKSQQVLDGRKLKHYLVDILIDGEVYSSAKGYSIKKAEKIAAETAFKQITNGSNDG